MLIFLFLFSTFVIVHCELYAVLVDTSKFWFNYRHAANALSIYSTLKQWNVPDNNIIIMLSEDIACNTRNVQPGYAYKKVSRENNIYQDVEIDYRGPETNVKNLLSVLTGLHADNTPASKRLSSDKNSTVLVYLTGHGGDGFLKFQDFDSISSWEIAMAFRHMHLADTCQAATLFEYIDAPNVFSVASSKLGEHSLSYNNDMTLGISLMDRFTYHMVEFIHNYNKSSISAMIKNVISKELGATAAWKKSDFNRSLDKVPILDYFSHKVKYSPLLRTSYDLSHIPSAPSSATSRKVLLPKMNENTPLTTPFILNYEMAELGLILIALLFVLEHFLSSYLQ